MLRAWGPVGGEGGYQRFSNFTLTPFLILFNPFYFIYYVSCLRSWGGGALGKGAGRLPAAEPKPARLLLRPEQRFWGAEPGCSEPG